MADGRRVVVLVGGVVGPDRAVDRLGVADRRRGDRPVGGAGGHPRPLLPERPAGVPLRPGTGDRVLALFTSGSSASCSSMRRRRQCGCAPNMFAVLPNADIDRARGGVACDRRLTDRHGRGAPGDPLDREHASRPPGRLRHAGRPAALVRTRPCRTPSATSSGCRYLNFEFVPPFAIALVPISFIAGVMYTRGLRSRVADLVIVARDKVDRALWERAWQHPCATRRCASTGGTRRTRLRDHRRRADARCAAARPGARPWQSVRRTGRSR